MVRALPASIPNLDERPATSQPMRTSPARHPRGAGEGPFVVLMPVFNDWAAARKVLLELDAVLAECGIPAAALLVDDGSHVEPQGRFDGDAFRAISRIDVLRLKRNVGHQRAICIGLAHIEAHVPCEAVVVMDGDGEDAPSDVPRLVARYRLESGQKIVFAERTKRSESIVFRIGYFAYRHLHRALTGHRVRVGNFSVVPHGRLGSLVVSPDLWSHYAACVFNLRQPYCAVPTHRAKRVEGRSSMDLVGLVTHGLSAIAVFGETIGVRLLIGCLLLAAFAIAGIGAVVAIRLLTPLAIPGWATFTAGLLLVVLLQAILMAVLFSFLVLNGRHAAAFLPTRDYAFFVDGVTTLFARQT